MWGCLFGDVGGKDSSAVSALALNSTLFPLSFYLVCLVHTHKCNVCMHT